MQVCAKEGDSRAKGVDRTVAYTLYRPITRAKKTLVIRAVKEGELDLKPDANNPDDEQLWLLIWVIDIFAAVSPA